MRAVGLLLGAGLVAATATLAPLWTYGLSLLLFGMPHVLVELRYVDERFGARLDRATFGWLAAGLAGIVLLRALALGELGDRGTRVFGELAVGALLLAAAVPLLRRAGRSPLAAMLPIAALLAGAISAPFATLIALALLHNLTPVGFLAERLRGAGRRRALLACAVVFGLMPALLLLGALDAALATLQFAPTHGGPFGTGDLDLHLPAFVPPALLDTDFADTLFATAAYLQVMHYAVVLHVLPALSGGSETAGARLPWPRPTVFLGALAVVSLGFTVAFTSDFAGTRSVYAVFAALHAWLELPVLALATGVLPARAHAALSS